MFPLSDIKLLVAFLRGGSAHTVADAARAAHKVLGFAIDQFFSGPVVYAGAAPLGTDADLCAALEAEAASHELGAARGTGAWALIAQAILSLLLDRLLK